MDSELVKPGKYTYGDYLTWPEGERWELLEGAARYMSPGPSRLHQKVSGRLFVQFFDYLKDKPCEVYNAPFDVRLPRSGEEDKVITVFKLGDNRQYGRPDVYAYEEKIEVGIFPDLVIDLEAVFLD